MRENVNGKIRREESMKIETIALLSFIIPVPIAGTVGEILYKQGDPASGIAIAIWSIVWVPYAIYKIHKTQG